jgi:hypothetical protein
MPSHPRIASLGATQVASTPYAALHPPSPPSLVAAWYGQRASPWICRGRRRQGLFRLLPAFWWGRTPPIDQVSDDVEFSRGARSCCSARSSPSSKREAAHGTSCNISGLRLLFGDLARWFRSVCPWIYQGRKRREAVMWPNAISLRWCAGLMRLPTIILYLSLSWAKSAMQVYVFGWSMHLASRLVPFLVAKGGSHTWLVLYVVSLLSGVLCFLDLFGRGSLDAGAAVVDGQAESKLLMLTSAGVGQWSWSHGWRSIGRLWCRYRMSRKLFMTILNGVRATE